jgi:uncharacterized protein (DUF736 family)
MTTIAKMTKLQDGSFVGALVLPALDGRKIQLSPIEKKGKGPEFLVSVGGFEAGAAWLRTSKKGNAYVSVKLKDPSFHDGTIHPVLVKTESGYLLNWMPRARLPEHPRGQRNVEGLNAQQANASSGRF